MIGELFEHVGARFDLAVLELGRDFDPLGLLAGRMRDTLPDAGIRTFGILTYAAPVFFVGYLLRLYVAPALGLPTSGDANPITKFTVPERTHILLVDVFLSGDGEAIKDVLLHLILPSVTLAVAELAVYLRLLRTDMIATLQEDYITMAKAKGMPSRRILLRHAFRPSTFSLVTVAGELEALRQKDGALLRAYVLGARLALRLDDPDAARSLLNDALALNPNHHLATRLLAQMEPVAANP